ncbi:MAG: plasmid pRiA4b ORF-3 family protein [Firmicutes bacterium]|nr:plasmid pRiA4b ORF-3 family protein [Bacillota bacterium]
MQIALTKKLADAAKLDLPPIHKVVNPLFSWTANWTNVWGNRKREEMLVLVNNATRFTVAIYQVRRPKLKDIEEIIEAAIPNTLLSMNLNPELVNKYMELAGGIEFIKNHSRQAAAWVTRSGLESAFYVGREYDNIDKMFDDTVGIPVNYQIVDCSGKDKKGFYPYEAMIKALVELTEKQAYKYRAFELLISLDLNIYKATRRIIVPANIKLTKLHKVLQSVFNWKGYHLYDFIVYNGDERKPVFRIVPFEEDLEYDEDAVLMENHTLDEFLPEYQPMFYTYDMGDNWEHEIKFIREIEEYSEESPYLLEVEGQTPPEDVGGVGGYIDFFRILSDPCHPEYKEMKDWAGYWSLDPDDWGRESGIIRV